MSERLEYPAVPSTFAEVKWKLLVWELFSLGTKYPWETVLRFWCFTFTTTQIPDNTMISLSISAYKKNFKKFMEQTVRKSKIKIKALKRPKKDISRQWFNRWTEKNAKITSLFTCVLTSGNVLHLRYKGKKLMINFKILWNTAFNKYTTFSWTGNKTTPEINYRVINSIMIKQTIRYPLAHRPYILYLPSTRWE